MIIMMFEKWMNLCKGHIIWIPGTINSFFFKLLNMWLTQLISIVSKIYVTKTIWKTEMKHETQKAELQTVLFSLFKKWRSSSDDCEKQNCWLDGKVAHQTQQYVVCSSSIPENLWPLCSGVFRESFMKFLHLQLQFEGGV